ncbi:glycosyltransferase family 22 protein [Mixia osmundae IAM 14324]|uniref:Mannosyltransferase n=1 Tax=Mixia osmundae (strain CBS 9802 / IAM 14324 / JCM 22182 / KY 12970) TaxID=764103 RepID=G7E0C7_MIXOS|nr:glycosyltransferase family 22 protein [Mixia osmundae IAM 14324]KEI42279.1 glycosyltransferase family 22 protein [Mixia osmundae IAM 14324]GAA96287.1 hypothetical protein E5Q_02953 [Mixia osmundae IAM 14324]
MEALLVLPAALHLWLAPYTKVEESFSLHASYDMLKYGTAREALYQYDHVINPGPVPRSFIGPLCASMLTKLFNHLSAIADPTLDLSRPGMREQIILRSVIGLYNISQLGYLARRIGARHGRPVQLGMLILCACQFHLCFYMTRTLPNMFAFGLTQNALGRLLFPLPRSCSPDARRLDSAVGILMLTFAAFALRFELLALLGPVLIAGIVRQHFDFWHVFFTGQVAAILSVAATFAIDTYFWQRTVWPEAASVLFNVVENKSQDWGVSPPLAYFTTLMPKMLTLSYTLALFGCLTLGSVRNTLAPTFAFIALVSLLGHKEWRFIVYVVPLWNFAAVAFIGHIYKKSRALARLIFGVLIVSTIAVTCITAVASYDNYPGGVALRQLHAARADQANVTGKVHFDTLTAMTGASLFLHEFEPTWQYDKTETFTTPDDYGAFDYLIVEQSPTDSGRLGNFALTETISGFTGLRMRPFDRAPALEAARRFLSSPRRHEMRALLNHWPIEKTLSPLFGRDLLQIGIAIGFPLLLPRALGLVSRLVTRSSKSSFESPTAARPKSARWRMMLCCTFVALYVYAAARAPSHIFRDHPIPLDTPDENVRMYFMARNLYNLQEQGKAESKDLALHTLEDDIQDLLSRLTSYEARLIYVLIGDEPLRFCDWCRPGVKEDYILFALPWHARSFAVVATVIGLLTASTGRTRWRPLFGILLLLAVIAQTGALANNSTEDMHLRNLQRGAHITRHLYFALLVLLARFLPAARPVSRESFATSIAPVLLRSRQMADETALRIAANDLLTAAILRDEPTRRKVMRVYAVGDKQAEVTLKDERLRKIANELQEREGVRTHAEKLVTTALAPFDPRAQPGENAKS